MNLEEIQKEFEKFIKERKWEKAPASQVMVHLNEEISEIGRHILIEEGYKKVEGGNSERKKELGREFAQALNLLMQLAIHFNVNLEESWKSEIEIMKKRFPKEKWNEILK